MSRLSLRTRLLVGVIALAAVGLVAADVATYSSLRSYLVGQVDSTLDQVHVGIESAVFGGPGGPSATQVPGDCVQVRRLGGSASKPVCFPAFRGEEEQPLPKLPADVSLPSHANTHEGDRVTYFTVPTVSEDGQYRVRASEEAQHPGYVLLIAQPLRNVNSTLHRLLLIELLVTAVVLAALAALALWIIRVGLRPLRAIEATAGAITAGDLSRRVEHPDPQTEVGRVGTALNEMLDRIEASDRRLRRFIADASHELRTPLAAVRAYAELFGRGAAARPEDLERSMSGITREAERMSLLVDDLLLLARLDEGRPLERKPVDLGAVVQESVDAARVVEPGRPIELSVEPATVTGDAARLHQVLDNLLANARAHTPAGTPVAVELRSVDGRAQLTVADHGPGLTEEQAARVFERFYRADSSRTRASGGAGLGLSIVSAVVEAHGGTVETRPTPGGGATFAIALPLAAG
ncbi:MAG TPA: HAMP domain-containing sensor histidine kinase [Gaiellaceae bacterium]|nr:HAMP domain-containing sensor histidine kinase [Gaiellaceae bacterium]